jgi:hypothetical protein
MTINKQGWLNHFSSTDTNTVRPQGQAHFAPEAPQNEPVPPVFPIDSRAEFARLTPLDDRGQPEPESLVRLSSCDKRGISFEHHRPLSARRALITVNNADFGRLEAEVQLSWCRFNHMGHYTSGGRFVQPMAKIA